MRYYKPGEVYNRKRAKRLAKMRRLGLAFMLIAAPVALLNMCSDDEAPKEPEQSIEQQLEENAESIVKPDPLPESYAIPQHARSRDLQLTIVETARQQRVEQGGQHFLLVLSALESTLNPDAAAPKGSARGLYQFVEQTWLESIRKHGHKYGLGDEADLIKKGKTIKGKYNPHYHYVDNADEKQRILDMRFDPVISTQMAIEYTKSNQSYLVNTLGQDATTENLYALHFLGRRHSTTFFRVLDSHPNWNPVDYFKNPSKRNKGIFYFADGKTPRSFGQVYDYFKTKIARADRILTPSPPKITAQAKPPGS